MPDCPILQRLLPTSAWYARNRCVTAHRRPVRQRCTIKWLPSYGTRILNASREVYQVPTALTLTNMSYANKTSFGLHPALVLDNLFQKTTRMQIFAV
jgi:hypothetical protein